MSTISTVNYEQVKSIAEEIDCHNATIIDVRRLDEVTSTGRIPHSLHIPGVNLFVFSNPN